MATAELHWFDINSIDGDDLSKLNVTGGPNGQPIGTDPGVDDQNYGDVQAGVWSVPEVLAIQFTAETAKQISVRLYDYSSDIDGGGSEDFYSFDGTGSGNSGDWDFRVKVYENYVDPSTITAATIDGWDYLPRGLNVAGYLLDDKFTTGNQTDNPVVVNGTNLLIPHDTDASTWVINAYVYIAFKPQINAQAGTHRNWGYRFNYVYPAA